MFRIVNRFIITLLTSFNDANTNIMLKSVLFNQIIDCPSDTLMKGCFLV